LTLNDLQRFCGTLCSTEKRLKKGCLASSLWYNVAMKKTIKTSVATIVILITVTIGYAVGFNHCQKMWENKIIEQIKKS